MVGFLLVCKLYGATRKHPEVVDLAVGDVVIVREHHKEVLDEGGAILADEVGKEKVGRDDPCFLSHIPLETY